MDPLTTNRIDPAPSSVSDKRHERGDERPPVPRRKRPEAPEQMVEEEGLEQEPESDTPKHALDDLA